jgi:hypothetical protein
LDGSQDSQVASATAQDAIESPPNLGFRGMGIFVKQHLGIHEHAVHAVPALRCLFFNKRLLEPVRMSHAAQTLERSNVPAFCILHCHAA